MQVAPRLRCAASERVLEWTPRIAWILDMQELHADPAVYCTPDWTSFQAAEQRRRRRKTWTTLAAGPAVQSGEHGSWPVCLGAGFEIEDDT